MRLPRPAFAPLALILLGPVLLSAQEQPLAAGSEGVPVPKKKKHIQPVYPPEALAQGIRGIVILDLVIDTEGRVVETAIIRSIPGLDEAALIAAQQWLYHPVELDGKPVSVRLTVPITFALKLPEMSRQDGIPELRQGVTPPWPTNAVGRGQAVADVTLEPDGRIGLARIVEGEEPWSTSLLQALRTWRFRSLPDDVSVSFRVEAAFTPRKENGDVELRLTGLRETEMFDAPVDEPVDRADTGPAPAPAEPRPEVPAAPAAPEPTEAPEPAIADASPPAASPEAAEPRPEAPEPVEAPAIADAGPPAPSPEATEPQPEAPAPPVTPAEEGAPPIAEARPPATGPEPSEPQPPAAPAPAAQAAASPAPGAATGGVDPTAPPPIEVLTASPPPLPPENGISAIRGVELEPGVPDLTRGRRPVAPPFARMAGASGVVTVEFSVSAGGVTAVQRADGPEVFQPAATQAVESWIFRRTRADRAYLSAVFKYEDDLASAIIRPQPAP